MKQLEIKVFKYGTFQELITFDFLDIEELKNWIIKIQDYTIEQKEIEKECGESVCKFSGSFIFEDKEYFIYLDF